MEAPDTLVAWGQEVGECQKIVSYKDGQRASTWFQTGMLANFIHMNVKMERLKRLLKRFFRNEAIRINMPPEELDEDEDFTDDDVERLLSDARDLVNYTLFMLACYRHGRVGWEDWD